MASSSEKLNHDTEDPSGFWVFITIGIIALLIVLVFVWAIYFYRVTKSEEVLRKQGMYESKILNQQRLYEKEFLNRLEWKNKSKKTVYIPLDLAIEKTIKEYK